MHNLWPSQVIWGLTLSGIGYGAPQYGVLSVIVTMTTIMGIHTLALQGVRLDVTYVTSTHFVPVLVPVGFIGQNKSSSHTQVQGSGNCNPTMCQKEKWKYHWTILIIARVLLTVGLKLGKIVKEENFLWVLLTLSVRYLLCFRLLLWAPSQGPYLPPS